MSIAEMIMQGGNQQSKSWSVLSENLGRLGQEVGNQLAMREYQKQAATALPAMQAAYKSAMDDVAAGEVTQGYKKFMDAQFQFGTSQNPFIAEASNAAGNIFQNAVTIREKQMQRQAQYGGGIGGGLPVMSGAEEAQIRLGLGGQDQGMPMAEGGQPEGMPEGILYPEGQPTQGTPDQQKMQAEQQLLDQQNAAQLPTQAGIPAGEIQPDKVQIDARNAASQVMSATPLEQNKAITGATITDKDKGIKWQTAEITNLSRFFPKTNISDKIGIAPVGSKVDYSQTWSGETGKAWARFSGNKKVEVDNALNKMANEYATNLQDSVNLLTDTGPIGQDKTWIDVIEEGGGIQNFIPQMSQDQFVIKQKGKESIDTDKNVFGAFQRIKGLSAFASRTGIKLMQEGGESTAELRSRRFGSAEEALSSGLPAGTRVYILKDGKYKAATIKE